MEILIFCGIYAVELACYLVVLRMLFDVRIVVKIWMGAGILVPVVVGGLPIDSSGKNFIISIGVVLIMFLSIKEKLVEKGVWLILVLLLLECVDGIFTYPCEKFIACINNNYIENLSYLASNSCTIICVFILFMIKEKMNHYEKIHINSVIYFIIGMIVVSMMVCLELLNQVVDYLPNNRYVIFSNGIYLANYISIFLLIIFVLYIKRTHERMEQLLKTEQLLKESQVNYYKQVLKKEMNTRKYRHDMVNHLVYVQEILNKNKVDDALRYLSHILGGFKKLQNSYYVTGNEMVDTIMNHFFGMLPDAVAITIKGRCPLQIDMKDTDVCTVFSNVFQNAVEEIIENEIKDAKVMIEVQKGKQYAEYKVKNSLITKIDEKSIDRNGLPKSHKDDKKNHGIGMVNVRKAVERYNGKFEWYQEKGYFCVKIVLPVI